MDNNAVKSITILLILSLAAIIDWREHRVPNWLTFPAMGAGLLYNALLGMGVMDSGLGILVGLATLILPYALNGMGAGDAKLMMAVGAWLGPWATFQGFIWVALVGCILSIALIFWHGRVKERLVNLGWAVRNLFALRYLSVGSKEDGPPKVLLPYGVPIALGFYAYFLFGGLL